MLPINGHLQIMYYLRSVGINIVQCWIQSLDGQLLAGDGITDHRATALVHIDIWRVGLWEEENLHAIFIYSLVSR